MCLRSTMGVAVGGVPMLQGSLVSCPGVRHTVHAPFIRNCCLMQFHTCLLTLSRYPPSPSLTCLQLPSTFHWQLDLLVLSLFWSLLVQDWEQFAVWWVPACVCVCVYMYVCASMCVYVRVVVCSVPTDIYDPFLQYKCWHPEKKNTPRVNASPWQK